MSLPAPFFLFTAEHSLRRSDVCWPSAPNETFHPFSAHTTALISPLQHALKDHTEALVLKNEGEADRRPRKEWEKGMEGGLIKLRLTDVKTWSSLESINGPQWILYVTYSQLRESMSPQDVQKTRETPYRPYRPYGELYNQAGKNVSQSKSRP